MIFNLDSCFRYLSGSIGKRIDLAIMHWTGEQVAWNAHFFLILISKKLYSASSNHK